jgi:predicted negative regulator of RcsB-dependent stress response
MRRAAPQNFREYARVLAYTGQLRAGRRRGSLDEYLSEQEQWEAVKRWIRDNGLWIVAGVAVGAAAIGGWQWRNAHIDKVNAEASAKYEQLLTAAARNDESTAMAALGELERDYGSTPYVDQARLVVVRIYVENGHLDKAVSELEAVIQHSKDKQLAVVARMRLARVQIAQLKPDDALATLNNGGDPGAFAPRFHEIRGDADFAKGDKSGALAEYRAARSTDLGGGGGVGGGSSLLDLKISDLVADTGPPGAAGKAPTAQTAVKK